MLGKKTKYFFAENEDRARTEAVSYARQYNKENQGDWIIFKEMSLSEDYYGRKLLNQYKGGK